jgi:galactokinase
MPSPHYQVVSPGRVNLLGEHVDYNDGIVLPVAINRYVHLQARLLDRPRIILRAVDIGEQASIDLEGLVGAQNTMATSLPHWARYPAGVAWAALRNGLVVRGIEAAFTSTVPIGAGLSSSAAVELAFAGLWDHIGQWHYSGLALAQLCQRAENEFVGVNCGLMDQFACACGIEDHALKFDTRSLAFEAVPLPAASALVIADSGVRRSLATSAYNQRRADCQQAVDLLKNHLPHIRSLRDVSPAQFSRYAANLPEVIQLRARHVVEEIARVEEAVIALNNRDVDAFGRLMLAGHASLRDLFQVSIPELDLLVEIASELPGCWGARLSGAGFGGCTVNLVAEQSAPEFIRALDLKYREKTSKPAKVYLCRASSGVRIYPIQ